MSTACDHLFGLCLPLMRRRVHFRSRNFRLCLPYLVVLLLEMRCTAPFDHSARFWWLFGVRRARGRVRCGHNILDLSLNCRKAVVLLLPLAVELRGSCGGADREQGRDVQGSRGEQPPISPIEHRFWLITFSFHPGSTKPPPSARSFPFKATWVHQPTLKVQSFVVV